MKADRIHNFNAGPAALPLPVLEEIQESFLNFGGSGMSVTEVSHRSKWFDDVINDAITRVKRILKLDDRYHVLFLQGGASMQFCMVPMNLIARSRRFGGLCQHRDMVDQSHQGGHDRENPSTWWPLPKINFTAISRASMALTPTPPYAHITSNNTIKGTQWAQLSGDRRRAPSFRT
jgi:phosphoserine aminotransferase